MIVRSGKFFLFGVLLALALSACQGEDPFPNDAELTQITGLLHLDSPPTDPTNALTDDTNPGHAAALALGTQLFDDKGVSSCGTISCASCHPAPAYTVNTAHAQGCNGKTPHNPPTLLNIAFNDTTQSPGWYFWDGHKDTLWSQALGPLMNPIEMAQTPEGLQAFLQSKYAAQYEAIFGKQPKDETDVNRVVANFGKVMETYERTLTRVKAPFDEQLLQFEQSVKDGHAEQDPLYLGLKTFIRSGRCIACHGGPTFSDRKFHNIGVDGQGVTDHARLTAIDQVLADPFNSAGVYSDDPADGAQRMQTLRDDPRTDTDGAFRTASLRNIALTGPYMHAGQLATLDQVIEFYNRGGDPANTFTGQRTTTIIPLMLTTQEKVALEDLLRSLTGSETP